jgi:hypothetical protein
MRRFVSTAALFLSIGFAPLALAQTDPYVPTLGDIMGAAQWRHIKLWFAGKNQNWELASYERLQIRAGLEQATTLYHGIPVDYVGATVAPIQALGAAIEAKDKARFVAGFNALTAACNACYQAIGRAFVVIQVPTISPLQRPVVCSTQESTAISPA